MPLPLSISCFSKNKSKFVFIFLVPAHPGSPGKRAVKRACVCYAAFNAPCVGHKDDESQAPRSRRLAPASHRPSCVLVHALPSQWSPVKYRSRHKSTSCDHDLFTKATRYGHCLHHLLPATRPVDHLRPRGHPFQLYPVVTDLHKRSFIVRSLFNFTWLMYVVYFICSFSIITCFVVCAVCVCHTE